MADPVAAGRVRALTLFFGKRTPGKGSVYGIAGVGAAFVMSLGVLWHFVGGHATYAPASLQWFTVGPLHLELGVYVDGLTAIMLVVVTSISLMVHIYSLGYMDGDARFTWFYVVLSLFTGAMLTVVVSNNLIELLLGWEVMGVCSYLLIGHWWEEKENSNAAIKAFITTRIGDIPFMFGIIALIAATGFTTTNIQAIGEAIAPGHAQVSQLFISVAAILLFGGTVGKSAQFPLHVWLPDAMAGPTPVSALIHAATMVAAGVYLIGRMFEVFLTASPWVLTTVSIVAAITMLGAALLAIVQDDIKRVLAYSTISQLSYMIAGLSLGKAGLTAGFFHLFTHAFFKALLFLGAGSVIHAVHSNNMSDMGGLKEKMPTTFWTMLIGSLALAGIFPLAGFWSKDALLVAAWNTHHTWLFAAFAVTALITAFYTTRMVLLTFFGEYRGHAHPHESPPTMAVPLVILAGATALVGFLGSPILKFAFGKWVFFEEVEAEHFVAWIALLGTAAAVLGILGGYSLYATRKGARPHAGQARARVERAGAPLLHRCLLHELHHLPGARQPVGGRVLGEPERHRRRRQRGRGAGARAVRRGDVDRPQHRRRLHQRPGHGRGHHRRRAQEAPVGQRAVVRGRPVRGRGRLGHRLHQDRVRGSDT